MIPETLLRSLTPSEKTGESVITSVTENIDEVKKGSLFIAVKGRRTDGNKNIEEAFSKGALYCLTEENISREGVFRVQDVRSAFSLAASELYGRPQEKLTVTGITGTNGKTTTAEYIRYLLSLSDIKSGVIGTLGSVYEGQKTETGRTTPSPDVLFREMASLLKKGCSHIILEASSQGLSQKRVSAISFYLGVLTNTGTDHMDYHKTAEAYIDAKKMLFASSENALINADEVYAEEFISACRGKVKTYSAGDRLSDFSAKNIKTDGSDISYLFLSSKGIDRIRLKGTGYISIYNSLAAASSAIMLGADYGSTLRGLSSLPAVKGRAECLLREGRRIVIDYAHTPQALDNITRELSEITRGRLICVFGCGGDRDKGKRSEMGRIARENCHTVIITSDNPRSEEPEKITEDILRGITDRKNVYSEPSREKAIALARELSQEGDTVLIAGKGHEEYQSVQGKDIYFSDYDTVNNIFGN